MNSVELYSTDERKKNGVFYTPKFLAVYLAKKVYKYFGDQKIKSVFDPACGDSVLLRSFADISISAEKLSFPNILGIDIDKNAISNSILEFSNHKYSNFDTHFFQTDGLFPLPDFDSLEGWSRYKNDLNCPEGFDIALSNPPWGADLSKYNVKSLMSNFNLAKGQYDIFDLFTELILNNLRKGGFYGLILPDSIFSHDHKGFRCLLSNYTSIYLIARLGEKIFPGINRACVVLVGSNISPKADHLVDCFRLTSDFRKNVIENEIDLELVEDYLVHKVPQKRFINNGDCFFDIDLRTEELSTFDKILSNSVPIKSFVNNTRGAEISKKGIVCLCPNCDNWMPLPRSEFPMCRKCSAPVDLNIVQKDKIIMEHSGIDNRTLKVGEDLFRFTSSSKRWINVSKKGINYKDLNIYDGTKILVRKTGIGITASIDYENSITNQVVYILKLRPEFSNLLTLEFILAVLNSRALTYFLIKRFGENEWKSHPYLTQSALISLPFPKVNLYSSEFIDLMESVTTLIKNEVLDSDNFNISFATDIFIEKAVAKLFGLDASDYVMIFNTLSSSEQLIPIKRLVNCNVNDLF